MNDAPPDPQTFMPLDRELVLELVRVTEAGAIAASALSGRGDENAADEAAVKAMRAAFDLLPVDGTVVVKGGSVDSGYGRGIDVLDVRAGDVVGAPLNPGGQQAALSCLIVCEDDQDYSS